MIFKGITKTAAQTTSAKVPQWFMKVTSGEPVKVKNFSLKGFVPILKKRGVK